MKTYNIEVNSLYWGTIKAQNKDNALNCYARECGYKDFADLLANVPGSTRDEVIITEAQ